MLASSGLMLPPWTVPTSLACSLPILQHAGVQPFLDEPHDAPVRDPVLDEPHQPFVVERVEEAPDVRIEHPVHLLVIDADRERIQRLMRLRPGRNPYEKPRKSVS